MRMKKLGFYLSSLSMPAYAPQMAKLFMENGFTYFETDVTSENCSIFRQAVSEHYPRRSYTIAGRMPLAEKKELSHFWLKLCSRWKFDHLDYCWIPVTNEQERINLPDTLEFLRHLQMEGQIHHIGISFQGDAVVLDEILTAYPELEYVELVFKDGFYASVPGSCYQVAAVHRKPIIAVLENASDPSFSTLQCVMEYSHVMMVLPRLHQTQDMECAIRIFKSTQDQINACNFI